MSNLKLVRLINEKPYKKYNFEKNIHGVVLESNSNSLEVIFFNPNNVGEYVIVIVDKKDINFEKETIPVKFEKELNGKLDAIKANAKSYFEPITFKDYNSVELIVEKECYAKLGVHKGNTGCIMSSKAIQNYIEVDFSGIDKNGEYYGESLAVNINDIKIIKDSDTDK